MTTRRCLFIGGPLDGERRVIDRDYFDAWELPPLAAPSSPFETTPPNALMATQTTYGILQVPFLSDRLAFDIMAPLDWKELDVIDRIVTQYIEFAQLRRTVRDEPYKAIDDFLKKCETTD